MGNKLNKASTTIRLQRKKNSSSSATIPSNASILFGGECIKTSNITKHRKHSLESEDDEAFTHITEFEITPQTPPTPTLLYPHYESTTHTTLTISNSNNTLSDYDDSIQDQNLFHNSIIYLKNSYTNQQYL